MSRRLYLGSKRRLSLICLLTLTVIISGLPTDARSEDVSKFFDGYGRIIDCRVMTGNYRHHTLFSNILTFGLGFGFVEFENAKAGTVHVAKVTLLILQPGRRRCCSHVQWQAVHGCQVGFFAF
jgi:hypothetical protein